MSDTDEEKDNFKRDGRKKYKEKLPNKIVFIPNSDKLNFEHWPKKGHRNIVNFPRPYMAILTGATNSGKTLTACNILIRAKPHFDRILLCHCDKFSSEWDDFDIPPDCRFENNEIPNIDYFRDKDPNERWVIILEDVEFKSKDKNKELSILVRYICTHKNVSIILNYQSFSEIPIMCRRLAKIFIIWRPIDLVQMSIIERRVGLQKGELKDLFDTFCKTRYCSLCFDFTPDTPAPLRLNLFDVIKKVE